MSGSRDCQHSCEHNNYLFKFFDNTAVNFDGAIKNCAKIGGLLASDLDRDAYDTIENCCSFKSSHKYYIGLDGRTNKCMNSTRPFQWLQSKNCTDGNLWRDIKPNNMKQCVTIFENDNNRLRVGLVKCTIRRSYICQNIILPNATPTAQSSPIFTTVATDDVAILGLLIAIIVLAILLALILLCCFLYKKNFCERFLTNKDVRIFNNSDLYQLQNYPSHEG